MELGQHVPQGAKTSPSLRLPLPSLRKENADVHYHGAKWDLAVTEEPQPGHGHQSLYRACRCRREEKGKRGGNECWRITQNKRRNGENNGGGLRAEQ